MRIIGKVTRVQLAEIERRGVDPRRAAERIIAEAEARHPGSTIILRPRALEGFDIVAI